MKKRIWVFVAMILCVTTVTLYSQQATLYSRQGDGAQLIRSISIEDFDGDSAQEWSVVGSRFADAEVVQWQVVNAWPRVLYGNNPDEVLRAFGVRGGFTRQGHNYIEIIPPGGGAIELPGVVDELEMWIWSANLRYYVTIQIQDYRGIYHTLDMGSIRHLGWKQFSVRIPTGIPQRWERTSAQTNLRLVKLVLWTDPRERVDEFYVYFDEIRGVTNTHQRLIDGYELGDPQFIRENWGQ